MEGHSPRRSLLLGGGEEDDDVHLGRVGQRARLLLSARRLWSGDWVQDLPPPPGPPSQEDDEGGGQGGPEVYNSANAPARLRTELPPSLLSPSSGGGALRCGCAGGVTDSVVVLT